MSRGKPATMVALTPRQRSLLIKQRNKARVTVQQRNRIDIILGASAGQSNLHLCQRLSVGRSMVTHWRKHWAVSYSSLCTYQAGVAGQGVSDRDLLSRMLAVLEDALVVVRRCVSAWLKSNRLPRWLVVSHKTTGFQSRNGTGRC